MKLVNTALPQTLPKECEKASRIFGSFVDNKNNGLDGIIPRSVLENAKGFAIFTVFKAGFLFSARAGTGIVIAKLGDGTWSAPSAIGCAGLGVGGQVGAELTDFLIVLNSASAVKSFMSSGSLTLGGNLSVAIGPLGRNGEALGSVSSSGKVAAMYSYSKTRGLFGGVSVEGSVIVERQDANALAYNQNVTAKMLLSGAVARPEWASSLVRTLEACTGIPGTRRWIDDRTDEPASYPFDASGTPPSKPSSPKVTPGGRRSSLFGKKKDVDFPPQHWGTTKDSGSYFATDDLDSREDFDSTVWSRPSDRSRPSQSINDGRIGSTFGNDPRDLPHSRSLSVPFTRRPPNMPNYADPFSDVPAPEQNLDHSRGREADGFEPYAAEARRESSKPLSAQDGVTRAIALYNFDAVEAGDLTFSKGDVIVVTRKSDSTDDWWTGKVNGKEGVFPANFVELV
ncbi:hypothetical protein EDC04DRAFT_2889360 [Pisolithus marmoratus]|nr:hypothetical protein EDC04DRAFT_2889360 [Pisolithus marmoratus]